MSPFQTTTKAGKLRWMTVLKMAAQQAKFSKNLWYHKAPDKLWSKRKILRTQQEAHSLPDQFMKDYTEPPSISKTTREEITEVILSEDLAPITQALTAKNLKRSTWAGERWNVVLNLPLASPLYPWCKLYHRDRIRREVLLKLGPLAPITARDFTTEESKSKRKRRSD